ncbi:acyl-CoA synthetase bubblegum family member 1 isoform X2 [Ptiloglossa arizonensis]
MTTVQPVQSNGVIKGFASNEKEIAEKDTYYVTGTEIGFNGPDQILPADSSITTQANGRVKILVDNDEASSLKPISVPGLLTKTANLFPNQIALVTKPDTDGKRKTYTYKEYKNTVRIVAKAFLKLGLERYHGVCVLGFNSPEWLISDLAAIHAGGFAVGVYTTNTAEACQYCANNSRANIIVVDDTKQLEKILQIKDNLPHLKAIIIYDGTSEEKDVLCWNDVLKIGEKESDDKLNDVIKQIAVNECCTLVYTSGTVGNPKAVMLSHDNLTYDAQSIIKTLRFSEESEVLVSYLPLSHVAAQVVDIYCCITIAATLYFADKSALKGTLLDTLTVARPTVLLSIPRVWEKIYEKMQVVASNNGIIKSWIASWAKAQGLYYNLNKMNNGIDYKHWGYLFAKWFIFNKVRATLGLDRSKLCISAAAPLSTEIKQYFMSLDIPILEAYGMSESSGAHCLGTPNYCRLSSVGKSIFGAQTKFDNPDSNGEGEICMRGRHIFMGYLNDPEKTAESLKVDGWLFSGDLGKTDKHEFLYVTGRIKELIITAGGENIPPVQIEQLILAELPALSNAVLIGDKRKYLTLLVSLKTDVSLTTGEPKDTFSPDTLKWLASIGSTATTVSDVINNHDPLVYKEIDKAIKRVNNKVISNAQKVQKFRILPHDFSVVTGELGPTLKLKRRIVSEMYKSLIDDMYK